MYVFVFLLLLWCPFLQPISSSLFIRKKIYTYLCLWYRGCWYGNLHAVPLSKILNPNVAPTVYEWFFLENKSNNGYIQHQCMNDVEHSKMTKKNLCINTDHFPSWWACSRFLFGKGEFYFNSDACLGVKVRVFQWEDCCLKVDMGFHYNEGFCMFGGESKVADIP